MRPDSDREQSEHDIQCGRNREGIAKFDSVIAPDCYIFANSTRFNGDAIMGAIKALHAAGKSYDEHVAEPDIHISGNIACIAYVNKGSITDASGIVNQESAPTATD